MEGNNSNNSGNIQETIKELMEINQISKISLEELKLSKKIGEGGQAKVYRGKLGDDEVAVKVLQEVDWKCLAHEIVIISNLKHPCIPRFYGIVLEEGIIALVTQFINGRSLDEFKFSEFSENQKAKIVKQLASALDFIHSNNFIHRDLKPENVMIDKNCNVFLIDFGIAKVCTNKDFTITRAKGTIHYLAPETLDAADLTEAEEIVSYVTTKVDVWAFGCIVSYLYSSVLPWCNKYVDSQTVIQKLLLTKKPFPIPDSIKNEAIVQIIAMATKTNPEDRATMTEITKISDTL